MLNIYFLITNGFQGPRYYIDPGTGSMLFTVLIGAISVFVFALKGLLIKLRTSFGRKDNDKDNHKFLIYTDSKRYFNTFKPILDEFEKRKTELLYLTQSEDDPIFNEKYEYIKSEYIGNTNSSFAKLNFINADVLLSTTPSLDVYQWKRSKTCKYYIHIPHAISDITLYRLFGIDYYDAVLVPGKLHVHQIRELEKIRNIKEKDVEIVGLTYFDEMKKRLDNLEKVQNENKVVLVAPSWGQSSLLNKYGSILIDELLNTGYEIVIRPHPQSFIADKDIIDELMKKYPNISWNKDNDNFDILNKSDILISDFSGVIFDYSLIFNKPVIYTIEEFDDSVYDSHWLDEKIWTFEVLPTIGKELSQDDFKNIKSVIDSCIDSKEFEKGRQQARDEVWSNVGNSAKDICEYMINKQKEMEAE